MKLADFLKIRHALPYGHVRRRRSSPTKPQTRPQRRRLDSPGAPKNTAWPTLPHSPDCLPLTRYILPERPQTQTQVAPTASNLKDI